MLMNSEDFRKHSYEVERLEQRLNNIATLRKSLTQIEAKTKDYDLHISTNGVSVVVEKNDMTFIFFRALLDAQEKVVGTKHAELTDVSFNRVP